MFGCLRSSIFINRSLSIDTKRCVYVATVLSTLLYGAETWAVKAIQTGRIQNFLNRCIRCIIGVSRQVQWRERITTEQLVFEFGMTEEASVLLALHRLRWLGHVGRMTDDHLPKQLLFGELLSTRPFHGPNLRWRDVVQRDLRNIGFDSTSWYAAVRERARWYDTCQAIASCGRPTAGAPAVVAGSFGCSCGRTFRRQGNLTRHRYFCDRQLPPSSSLAMEFRCDCG